MKPSSNTRRCPECHADQWDGKFNLNAPFITKLLDAAYFDNLKGFLRSELF